MSSNDEPRLSPPLADLRGRGDGFRTPRPAYFDDLAERVLQSETPRRSVTRRVLRSWLAVAASLLVLLVAGFLHWPAHNPQPVSGNPQPKTADEILADIDPADIEAYITADLDNYEAELYADNN